MIKIFTDKEMYKVYIPLFCSINKVREFNFADFQTYKHRCLDYPHQNFLKGNLILFQLLKYA